MSAQVRPMVPESVSLPGAAPARAVSSTGFQPRILLLTALCVLPAAGLLAIGRPAMAGPAFWGTFALVGGALVLLRRPDEIAALAIALAPPVNLLRDLAFYNVVVAVGVGAVLAAALLRRDELRARLRPVRALHALAALSAVYYVLSLLFTGDYAVNLRVFELVAAVVLVLFLTRRPGLLAPTLLALVLSSVAIALVMTPYMGDESVERLGQIQIDGYRMGNPVQIGVPLALGLLLCVGDRGIWLGLSRRPALRLGLASLLSLLLLLTTSRAAWLVAVAGIGVVLLLGRRGRVQMLLLVGLGLAAAFVVVPRTPFGEFVEKGFSRTFDEERTARNRTSGRSDQWIVAGEAMTRSVSTFFFGSGPGTGAGVYARLSSRTPGIEYAVGRHVPFHSLYMQIGVETGAVGLTLLLLWIAAVHRRAWQSRALLGAMPTVAAVGWAIVALTVSANDTVSGVLLGLALTAAALPTPTIRRFA